MRVAEEATIWRDVYLPGGVTAPLVLCAHRARTERVLILDHRCEVILMQRITTIISRDPNVGSRLFKVLINCICNYCELIPFFRRVKLELPYVVY